MPPAGSTLIADVSMSWTAMTLTVSWTSASKYSWRTATTAMVSLVCRTTLTPGGGPFPIPRPSLSQLEREPNPPPSTQWEAFYTKAWTNPVTQAAAPKMSTPTRSLPLMPGERLKSYDTDDITGSLPPQLEAVLQAAADVIGVDASEVAEVVERFERRMEAARPRRVQSNSSPAMNRVRGGIRESHSFG